MAAELRAPLLDSRDLKKPFLDRCRRPALQSRLAPCAWQAQQAVDDLFVKGGQPVDTKSCVRPDSCICKKVVY
jgi:hypothetical protein